MDRIELLECAKYLLYKFENATPFDDDTYTIKCFYKGLVTDKFQDQHFMNLADKGVLIYNKDGIIQLHYSIKDFIKNDGYTEEELKEIKEDYRKDKALRYSKWANVIAGFAFLFSIMSLIISFLK